MSVGRTQTLLGIVAFSCGALIAAGSQALALKIPIQATLTGGGEVPPNESPAKGLMQGTFDTDTQHPRLDGYLFGPVWCADRRPFPRPGLLSRADAGGERSDPGRNARQSREPVPWRSQDRRHPGPGPQGRALVFQPSLDEDSGRRNPWSRRPPISWLGSVGAALALTPNVLRKRASSDPEAGKRNFDRVY